MKRRPHPVYPGGAMILHYDNDNHDPPPAGLAPVER